MSLKMKVAPFYLLYSNKLQKNRISQRTVKSKIFKILKDGTTHNLFYKKTIQTLI